MKYTKKKIIDSIILFSLCVFSLAVQAAFSKRIADEYVKAGLITQTSKSSYGGDPKYLKCVVQKIPVNKCQ